MSEFDEDVAEISGGFAEIFSKAAVSQNIQKLRIAEGSVSAATSAIELEKQTGKKEIARALAKHTGSVAAFQAASGGGTKGTGEALVDSATFQAADQAAILEANAAAKEVAVIFQNQPILDDPVLAAVQGLQVGTEISVSIVQSLFAEADVRHFATPAGFSTVFSIPGFDLNDFLDGLGAP